jgi:hypothetical protein
MCVTPVNVGTVRGIEMINDTNIKVNMIIDYYF